MWQAYDETGNVISKHTEDYEGLSTLIINRLLDGIEGDYIELTYVGTRRKSK